MSLRLLLSSPSKLFYSSSWQFLKVIWVPLIPVNASSSQHTILIRNACNQTTPQPPLSHPTQSERRQPLLVSGPVSLPLAWNCVCICNWSNRWPMKVPMSPAENELHVSRAGKFQVFQREPEGPSPNSGARVGLF